VPIAAGLIHMGASPGAALAFLISGPASNPATITTVWKLLGRRTTALYLLAVVISAIGGGLTLDWLMSATGARLPPLGAHVHEAAGTDWLAASSAIVLLLVVAYSYVRRPSAESYRGQTALADPAGQPASTERVDLAIAGMTCSHCVAAVTHALGQCGGVASVQVDLATGRATVTGEELSADELVTAVASVGYRASAAV
jgi:copper chaperone CopZ